MVAHYSRVTPIQLPIIYNGQSYTAFIPITRSTLPPANEVNNVAASTVCRLLPKDTAFLKNGLSESDMWDKRRKFLNYLRGDEDDTEDELELLR